MIEVERLSTGYNHAFQMQDISFRMEAGEFFGIIGPNGSGKSTLLKALSRVIKPAGGKAVIHGKPIEEYSIQSLARIMAVVGSEAHFGFPFRVIDVVLMGRLPFLGRLGAYSAHDFEVAEESLRKTESLVFRDRLIHQLSSGERQRVLLARALAQEPKILLLDEPTAHLDMHFEVGIFRILKSLHETERLTVLTVSHNLNLVSEFCGKLIVLNAGKCARIGTPAEVLKPELLRDIFRIECDVTTNPFSGAPSILLKSGA